MPPSQPPPSPDHPVAVLSRVADDVADVIKGYEAMADRSDAETGPVIQRLLVLHQAHAADLFEQAEQMGGYSEGSGAVMGIVRQAVATARDWFDSADQPTLADICTGERRLIETYDAAILDARAQADLRAMMEDQRAAIRAQVAALES